MEHSIRGAACTGLLIVASGAQAALLDRGGGLIFDTNLNITWLADANYYATTHPAPLGWDPWGDMHYGGALSWAENLTYYDNVRNVTYSDWRLPSTLQPDPTCNSQIDGGSYGLQGLGTGCTGSEMGHLFYVDLGGVAGQSLATTHNSNFDLFKNIQTAGSSRYWSSVYEPKTQWVWTFSFGDGNQGFGWDINLTGAPVFAWAVRDGDVGVATSSVPMPATIWLFGSGLLGLLGVSRRRRG